MVRSIIYTMSGVIINQIQNHKSPQILRGRNGEKDNGRKERRKDGI